LHAQGANVRAELEGGRGEFRARPVLAVFGVGRVALMAEGIAEMNSFACEPVKRVVRRIVAQPVAPVVGEPQLLGPGIPVEADRVAHAQGDVFEQDRKSTRLNSSHLVISYAVFCLKKKK